MSYNLNKENFFTLNDLMKRGYSNVLLVDFKEYKVLGYFIDMKNKQTKKAIKEIISRGVSYGTIIAQNKETSDSTSDKQNNDRIPVISIKSIYLDKKKQQLRGLVKQIDKNGLVYKFTSKDDPYKLKMNARLQTSETDRSKLKIKKIVSFNLTERSKEKEIEFNINVTYEQGDDVQCDVTVNEEPLLCQKVFKLY